jgi:hypothetical protein
MRAISAASATTTVLTCARASRPRSHLPSRVLPRLNVGIPGAQRVGARCGHSSRRRSTWWFHTWLCQATDGIQLGTRPCQGNHAIRKLDRGFVCWTFVSQHSNVIVLGVLLPGLIFGVFAMAKMLVEVAEGLFGPLESAPCFARP